MLIENSISRTLLVLISALSFSGCVLQIDDDYGTKKDFYEYGFKNIETSLKKTKLTCSSGAKCVENVGLIFMTEEPHKSNPKLSMCTGFLVADGIVGTNSHCIPEAMKSKYAGACSRHLAIRFKDFKGRDRTFNCEALLDYSDYEREFRDFAFFKIAGTGIEPLPISKEGLVGGDEIQSIVINPNNYSGGGSMEVKECETGFHTLVDTVASHRFAAVGSALKCQAVKGNSGSPVLNKRGEVIGILQSNFSNKRLDAMREHRQYDEANLPFELPIHFSFTNLSCVKDPVTNRIEEVKCRKASLLQNGDCLEGHDDMGEIISALEAFERILPEELEYYFKVEKNKDITISAIPRCVNPEVSKNFMSLKVSSVGRKIRKYEILPDGFMTSWGGLAKDSLVVLDYSFSRNGQTWTGNVVIPKSKDGEEEKVIHFSAEFCDSIDSSADEEGVEFKLGDKAVSRVEFQKNIDQAQARRCDF